MVVRKFRNMILELVSKFLIKKQKALLIDFQQAKERILEQNSRYIIEEKLVPYIINSTFASDNYLMSEKMAYKIATQMFLDGKRKGKIDSMNRLTKELA